MIEISFEDLKSQTFGLSQKIGQLLLVLEEKNVQIENLKNENNELKIELNIIRKNNELSNNVIENTIVDKNALHMFNYGITKSELKAKIEQYIKIIDECILYLENQI